MSAAWTQLPPLKADKIHVGCSCCSTACQVAHADMPIAVGFGSAIVTKDGECVYSEREGEEIWTVADAERLAAAEPDHDWRIEKMGPLHGETFQRHATGEHAGKWVCIESNPGFA